MLTVYGNPNSRSLRVVWALEEAGADYVHVRVDLFKGEGRQPPYINLNPTGKVPTLVDGDLVLAESGAIVTYIGERHPASRLVPPSEDRIGRAACFQWAFFTLSELEQPLWTIAKHRFALPEERRVADIQATAAWEFANAADILRRRLEGREYVAAEHFTAADILVAHTLAWARSARIPLGSPVLEDYADRMLARPALARARVRERS